jgi:hypothetical protein
MRLPFIARHALFIGVLTLFFAAVASGTLIATTRMVGSHQLLAYMTSEDLARGASFVIVGSIESQTTRGVTTSSGPRVFTDSSIAVHEVLKGAVPGGYLTVTTPGGKAGNVVEVAEDAVVLTPGKSVLLFVFRSPTNGELEILGGFQGRHFIHPSGVTTNERVQSSMNAWRHVIERATR